MKQIPGWLFLEWKNYDAIEPIGGRRADWHTAALLSQVANRYRNTHAFPKPFHARDFLLNFEAEARAPLVSAPEVKPKKGAEELFELAKQCAGYYNNADTATRPRTRRK